jgi:serine/threonine protein kinase
VQYKKGGLIAELEDNLFGFISKTCDKDDLMTILRQAAEQYDWSVESARLLADLQHGGEERKGGGGPSKANQLGNYQLVEKIGQGGMGVVYKAIHTSLNRIVALKILPAERMSDAKFVARFNREWKSLGLLNHPNIIQATDAGEVEGTCFLVMEFVEGIDLAKLTVRSGPLPIPEACELVRQAATGLQHAYEHGLIHRDLKPSNLMLAPTGTVKILDLGLARLCNPSSDSEELTSTGIIMGTPDYMAPELAFGMEHVDIRGDIYSLGCTLYHLLAGRAPFSGREFEGALKKLLAHSQVTPPAIQVFRPEIPRGLVALLDSMLAKNPADRFGTPAEAAAALQPFIHGADLSKLLPPESHQAVLPGTESYKAQNAADDTGGLPTIPSI